MLQNGLQNTAPALTCQPAPAGVRCRHMAAANVGQQHGQAVGHHDGANHAGLVGQAGIGACTLGGIRVEPLHLCAMHLRQKHRFCAQGLSECFAVDRDIQRPVPHMVTQIKTVVRRRRMPPRARGSHRLHALRRGPLGNQPVGVHSDQAVTNCPSERAPCRRPGAVFGAFRSPAA